MNLKAGILNAEGAEVSRRTQSKNYAFLDFCDFCVTFAPSAFGCPVPHN